MVTSILMFCSRTHKNQDLNLLEVHSHKKDPLLLYKYMYKCSSSHLPSWIPSLPGNSSKQHPSLDALSHPVKILLSPLTTKPQFQTYLLSSSWLEQCPASPRRITPSPTSFLSHRHCRVCSFVIYHGAGFTVRLRIFKQARSQARTSAAVQGPTQFEDLLLQSDLRCWCLDVVLCSLL